MAKKEVVKVKSPKLDLKIKAPELEGLKISKKNPLDEKGKVEKRLTQEKAKYFYTTGQEAETKERKGLSNLPFLSSDSAWNTPWWMTPFVLLQRPLQGVLQFIKGAREGSNPFLKMFEGVLGVSPDIDPTDALGINTENYSGVGKFFANLGLAIVLDPLNLLAGAGAISKVVSKVPQLYKTATALKTAMLGGRLTKKADKIVRSFGGMDSFLQLGTKLGVKGTDDVGKIATALSKNVIPVNKKLFKFGKGLLGLEQKYLKFGTFIWAPKLLWRVAKKTGQWASKTNTFGPTLTTVLRFYGARIQGAQQAARNLASKFKFGYLADEPTKESLTAIAQETQQFSNEVVLSGKYLSEMAEARARIIYDTFQGRVPDKQYLKIFAGKDFTTDIQLFQQAGFGPSSTFDEIFNVVNRQIVDRLAVTHQTLNRGYQMTKSLESNGFILYANKKQGNAMVNWLNNGETSPLRQGKGLVAVNRKIADVRDIVEMRTALGRPLTEIELKEGLRGISKSTKVGGIVVIRRVPKGDEWKDLVKNTIKSLQKQGKSKEEIKSAILKLRDEYTTDIYPLIQKGKKSIFNSWEKDLNLGKIDIAGDEQFVNLLKASKIPQRKADKIVKNWQALELKYLTNEYENIISHPNFAKFIEEGIVLPTKSIDNVFGGKGLGKTAALVSVIKQEINILNDVMIDFMTRKRLTLSEFFDFAKKISKGYRKSITKTIQNPLLEKSSQGAKQFFEEFIKKTDDKVFRSLIVKSYEELQTKRWVDMFANYLEKITYTTQKGITKTKIGLFEKNIPSKILKILNKNPKYKKKALTYLQKVVRKVSKENPTATFSDLTKRIATEIKNFPTPFRKNIIELFKSTRTSLKETLQRTNKQIKIFITARNQVGELLKSGLSPTDMRTAITNLFIKRLNGKLTKNQVNLVLNSFRRQMPQELYDELFQNISTKAKTLINEKVDALVKSEAKINRIAYESQNKEINKKLMNEMSVLLPEKTLTNFKYKDLSKMESLEYMTKTFQKTVDDMRQYLETFSSVPEFYRKQGYFPLSVNNEYSQTLAALTKVAKDNNYAQMTNPNLWLPNISERQIGKIPNAKTYITMRRDYLDNASFINSVLGYEMFNNETPMFYAELYKNTTPFFFKPVLSTFAYESDAIRIPNVEELQKYSVGDILPDGFRVVTRKDASEMLLPIENSLQRDGGTIVGKWKAQINKGTDVYENLPNYYRALSNDLAKLPKEAYNQLPKKLQSAIKVIKNNPLQHNRTTQHINTALSRIVQEKELLKKLPNSGWLNNIDFERYTQESVNTFRKSILSQKQDKILVQNSVWDLLNTKRFDTNEINKTYGFLSRGFNYFTGFWKGAVLWRNFAGYHLRNILGNYTNAIVGGINPIFYTKRVFQNANMMRKYNKMLKIVFNDRNIINYANTTASKKLFAQMRKMLKTAKYSDADIKNFELIMRLKRVGVMGNNRIKAETYGLYQKLQERVDMGILLKGQRTKGGKIIDTLAKGWNKNAEWNMFMDDAHRLTIYQYFTENPNRIKDLGYLNADQASRFVGFDFHQLTSFEKKYMQRLFPFYTWFRKNFEFHIANIGKNSRRYKTIYTMLKRWNSDMGNVKNEDMLEWQKSRNYLVLPTNPNRLLKLEIPFLNYDEIFGGRIMGANIISKINPFMKIMIEVATGRNFFYDRSIDANETTEHIVDSLLQMTTAKKRWGEFYKVIFGQANQDIDKLVALAPSVFSRLDKEKNQIRNKWLEVQRVEKLIKSLREGGTYIPKINEIRNIQRQRDKLRL